MPDEVTTSAATHEHEWQDTGFADLEDCAVEGCLVLHSVTTGRVVDPTEVAARIERETGVNPLAMGCAGDD